MDRAWLMAGMRWIGIEINHEGADTGRAYLGSGRREASSPIARGQKNGGTL